MVGCICPEGLKVFHTNRRLQYFCYSSDVGLVFWQGWYSWWSCHPGFEGWWWWWRKGMSVMRIIDIPFLHHHYPSNPGLCIPRFINHNSQFTSSWVSMKNKYVEWVWRTNMLSMKNKYVLFVIRWIYAQSLWVFHHKRWDYLITWECGKTIEVRNMIVSFW